MMPVETWRIYQKTKQCVALYHAAELIDQHVTSEVSEETAENLAKFLREMEADARKELAALALVAETSSYELAKFEKSAFEELHDEPEEDGDD